MVVDIDECKEPEKYPCHGICENTPGNYKCSCLHGMHGDAKLHCKTEQNIATTLKSKHKKKPFSNAHSLIKFVDNIYRNSITL